MSQYLFAIWDGGGTVPPELSLVRGLVARGHSVTTIADPTLAGEVEEAGSAFTPWARAPHRASDDPLDVIFADWEARTPTAMLAGMRDRFICGPAEAFAADVDEAVARVRPDAVVVDAMLLGAQVAAEASGLPWAALMPNIYFLPAPGLPPFGPGWTPATGPAGRLRERVVAAMSRRVWAKGLPAVNAARAARGLAALDDPLTQPLQARRVLVLSSAAFDFPARLPANVRHVGPPLDDPAWAGAWEPPAGDEPLVLVALSSNFQNQRSVLERIAAALGELPVRGIVTSGPAIAPEDVPAPANVAVVRSAPHGQVMAAAAAVVTHGGHGTVMKALAAGVPIVCMPMGRDQADNAARIVARGCGVRLAAGSGERRIRAALERVLADPGYRAAAARIGAALREESAGDPALAELDDLPHPAGIAAATR
jgi:MGT family glycosyltransferase